MLLQEDARVKHVTNTSIKEERAVSPDLVLKQEPVSDLDMMVNMAAKSLFRTVTENGQEIIVTSSNNSGV